MSASRPGPLAGRSVLIARAPGRAAGLAERLTALGAAVTLAPVTTTVAPRDTSALDAAVRRLSAQSYAWVVVTSVNAVEALTATAARLGLDWPIRGDGCLSTETGNTTRFPGPGDFRAPPAAVPRTRWASVGPATTAALTAAGLPAHLTPESDASAAGLLEAFRRWGEGDSRLPDRPLLLPHADLADPGLARGLRDLGWTVETVVTYRTVPLALPPPVLARWRAGGFDVVIVTAPSAVRSLGQQWQDDPGGDVLAAPTSRFVAIGRTTARAVEQLGWPTPTVAIAPTDEVLAAAVIAANGSITAAYCTDGSPPLG